MAQRTACVIGGGIAGLAAGVALRRAGYRVTLFEQAAAIAPMGAALSIWGNAMAGLDWLGCGDLVRDGSAKVESLALSTSAGTRLFGPVGLSSSDAYLPMRSHLQGVMLDALGRENVRLGERIEDVREVRDRVELVQGGRVVESAELCVVADGIHSEVATRLIGNPPEYRGYVGVLGIAACADSEWPSGHGEEIWHRRERFGLFDAGSGRRYWFYMKPARSADEAATCDLQFLRDRAERFPPVIGETVGRTGSDTLIPVGISARPIPRRLGKGRIVCVGDAAHAMEPNQGQGGCQGIEDAWALGVLAGRLAPDKILPELERLRLRRIRPVMRDSTLMGRAAHSPRSWERGLVRAVFSVMPKALDAWQVESRHVPPDYA